MAAVTASLVNGEAVEVDFSKALDVREICVLVGGSLGKPAASIVLLEGTRRLDMTTSTSVIREDLTVMIRLLPCKLEELKLALVKALQPLQKLVKMQETLVKALDLALESFKYSEYCILSMEGLSQIMEQLETRLRFETLPLWVEKGIVAELQALKRMVPKMEELTQVKADISTGVRDLDIRARVEDYCAEVTKLATADQEQDETDIRYDFMIIVNDILHEYSPFYDGWFFCYYDEIPDEILDHRVPPQLQARRQARIIWEEEQNEQMDMANFPDFKHMNRRRCGAKGC